MGSIPDHLAVVLRDRAVLGDEPDASSPCLGDDDAVEGITGLALGQGGLRDLAEGEIADLEADLSPKRLEHLLRGSRGATDLE